jgi:hypothetical protein
MSRPDAKKNITTLVRAFGENRALREIANLVLVMVGCCFGGGVLWGWEGGCFAQQDPGL